MSKKDKAEAELTRSQAALAELHRQLADPALYADAAGARIAQLNAERETLEARIATLEEEWLELEMALEDAYVIP